MKLSTNPQTHGLFIEKTLFFCIFHKILISILPFGLHHFSIYPMKFRSLIEYLMMHVDTCSIMATEQNRSMIKLVCNVKKFFFRSRYEASGIKNSISRFMVANTDTSRFAFILLKWKSVSSTVLTLNSCNRCPII